MAGRKPEPQEDSSLFFLCAILVMVVVPWTLAVIWNIATRGQAEIQEDFPTRTKDGALVRRCGAAQMMAKRELDVRRLRSFRRMVTKGFVARFVVLIVLWCWLLYIGNQVRQTIATGKMYENFDPHAILDIGRFAKKDDIKKAYRKLSIKYHPDKNQGDPEAVGKFIMMKKAYDALIDPVAKRNYELYGNPDGPVRTEIGMAIPSIKKEHQALVLILFVIFFVLGVPLSLLYFMSGMGVVCPNGVLRTTMEALARGVQPNLTASFARELLLDSFESQAGAAVNEAEAAVLEAIRKELLGLGSASGKAVPSGKKDTGGTREPAVARCKPETLLLAHVNRRRDLLDERLGSDLDELLRKWRLVSLAMVDLAARQGFGAAAAVCIDLHRSLVQSLDLTSPIGAQALPLLQVPHLTVDLVKELRKKQKKISGLPAFLDLIAEERQSCLEALGLNGQQLADIAAFVGIAPRLVLKSSEVYVLGEESVCQGDVATLKVTLERSQLTASEAADNAHAPLYLDARVREAWWILFTPAAAGAAAKSRIVRADGRNRELVVELKFKVPNKAKCKCKLEVLCEAYIGLDLEETITFAAGAPKEEQSDASGREDEQIDRDFNSDA